MQRLEANGSRSRELSRAARDPLLSPRGPPSDTRQVLRMLRNARCCCRERKTVASANYAQSEHNTGKLLQAAEVTVLRQSGTTHAIPHMHHGAPRRRPPSTRGRKERHAYRSRHSSPEAAHVLSREAAISHSLVVYRLMHTGTDTARTACLIALSGRARRLAVTRCCRHGAGPTRELLLKRAPHSSSPHDA